MNCYVCVEQEKTHDAVALCHHCSAGHALEKPQQITTVVPLNREVTLPIPAREILCPVCKQALDQPRRVA